MPEEEDEDEGVSNLPLDGEPEEASFCPPKVREWARTFITKNIDSGGLRLRSSRSASTSVLLPHWPDLFKHFPNPVMKGKGERVDYNDFNMPDRFYFWAPELFFPK